MAAPNPRRSPWLLGVLLLATLAPAPRAEDKAAGRAPSVPSLGDLQSGAARPEYFSRFIEGSRERRGGPEAPRAGARDAGRRPGAQEPLGPAQAVARPEPAAAPPVPAAAAARPPAPGRGVLVEAALPGRGMSAALGLGLLLIASSLVLDLIAPETAALPEAPAAASAPVPPAPAEFAPALARAEASAPPAPYVDARMPAPTWRAISWAEQKLIESWDASREKSLGLASLGEWIDAHGGAAGVDAKLLQAKLHRDA